MRMKHIIHEWSAEHLKWVQYPNHSSKTDDPTPAKLYFGTKLSLAVIGLFATVLGGLMLLFLAFIVIPSLFN